MKHSWPWLNYNLIIMGPVLLLNLLYSASLIPRMNKELCDLADPGEWWWVDAGCGLSPIGSLPICSCPTGLGYGCSTHLSPRSGHIIYSHHGTGSEYTAKRHQRKGKATEKALHFRQYPCLIVLPDEDGHLCNMVNLMNPNPSAENVQVQHIFHAQPQLWIINMNYNE